MKKKKGEVATSQNVDTGHKIHACLTHINVNAHEADNGCTPLHLAVLGGKCCVVVVVCVCVCACGVVGRGGRVSFGLGFVTFICCLFLEGRKGCKRDLYI